MDLSAARHTSRFSESILAGILVLLIPGTAPSEPQSTVTVAGMEIPLFSGADLNGWKIADYAGHGEVGVKDGSLILGTGEGLTGVTWTNDVPARMNYDIQLEAQRVDGYDFFCGLTFPVGGSYCTLILGGWGGGLLGLSSINGMDASENETTDYFRFEKGKWYSVRISVTPRKILVHLDDQLIIDVDAEGKEFDIRGDISLSTPLGMCSWQTKAAIRNMRMRKFTGPGEK